jgi:predicted amidophosphoribosyltransferase
MLKYEKYAALGSRIGRAMAGVLPRPDLDALVPVPLHLDSKRRYNQAEVLARGLGDAWGIEVLSAARWVLDVPRHAGASLTERLALPHDVFEFDEDISGLRVGIVDDVCTTGTTLSRLAEAVRASCANVAGAFVIAGVPIRR